MQRESKHIRHHALEEFTSLKLKLHTLLNDAGEMKLINEEQHRNQMDNLHCQIADLKAKIKNMEDEELNFSQALSLVHEEDATADQALSLVKEEESSSAAAEASSTATGQDVGHKNNKRRKTGP